MNLYASYKQKWNMGMLLLAAASPLLFSSCIKDDEFPSPVESTIYMPQAYAERASLSLFKLDSAQEITFGAAYAGFNSASENIQATFQLDTNLIATYNSSNNTAYVAFPSDAYTISGFTTQIPAGATSSDPLTISVLTNKLTVGVRYMLPIKMVSVSTGNLDSALSVAYFRIDSLTQRERDITNQATLSVSDENSGGASAGEGSPKLIDNDYNSKFLSFDYNPAFWFQLKYNSAQTINAYTFTSGNDAPERDPKTWTFEGSNDGSSWTVLDTQTDYSFTGRNVTVRFPLENTTAYTYYRANVTSNGGSSLFQMSEWRVIQFY